MSGDSLFAGGEDGVVVLHDDVGRQAAVFLRQAHRPAGGMEAHTQFAGRGDLGAQQVARAPRVEVMVVGGDGAAAERQLGEADPGAGEHGLFVDGLPQRVQALQPPEQRLVGHRRVGAGEVLEDVVMRVDEAWRDQAVGGVDDPSRSRLGVGGSTDCLDEPTGDGNPAAG